MNFLSKVLKDLADEYVMPRERFYSIWDNIIKTLKWELPEPRMPDRAALDTDDGPAPAKPP